MSLFVQLYEKIVPFTSDQKIARDLADTLTDALMNRSDEYATKKDIEILQKEIKEVELTLRKDMAEMINRQTWIIVSATGILSALFKYLPHS